MAAADRSGFESGPRIVGIGIVVIGRGTGIGIGIGRGEGCLAGVRTASTPVRSMIEDASLSAARKATSNAVPSRVLGEELTERLGSGER